jgi:hypothetical protein
MSATEKLSPTSSRPLSWADICGQHPSEWVCLLDAEHALDGSICSARVLGHHRSMKQMLAQLAELQPDVVVVHTSGRTLRSPRIEMTDEIRDIVRPRR